MKSDPIYFQNDLRFGAYSVMQIARYFTLTILGVLFLSFEMNAQKKKKDTENKAYRTLNTAAPKSESKLKAFDEYSEFVIADFRAGALEEVVESDESQTLKEELQGKFPINTVFASTHSKVCIIGVNGTANAQTILKAINTKASKIVKKADLDKTLSIINVKVVKKEEL